MLELFDVSSATKKDHGMDQSPSHILLVKLFNSFVAFRLHREGKVVLR